MLHYSEEKFVSSHEQFYESCLAGKGLVIRGKAADPVTPR